MIYVGIDYSMTSPAICILTEKVIEFHYWITETQHKVSLVNQQIKEFISEDGLVFKLFPYIKENNPSWNNDIERFMSLAVWSNSIIDIVKETYQTHDVKIAIEGYSFGSSGARVFQIAENCGILKFSFEQNKYQWNVVPPTQIKKFATGKGNANKEKMEEAFVEKMKFSPRDWVHQTKKQMNPSSDIIDAYFIADWLRTQH